MPAVDPDAKIPCPTPHMLQDELDTLAEVLEPPEKEETWEKFERVLIRLAGITRGGGYKHVDVYVRGVGPKGVGLKIVNCMLSDRGRLSGVSTDLLQTLAPRLAGNFAPLVALYLPPLVRLLARPNKVYLKRSEKCLATIITHCQLPSILVHLRGGLDDRSDQCKRACAGGFERAVTEWPREIWSDKEVETLEACVRKMATDRDAEVRKIAKRVWGRFMEVWPERVEEFAAPLTPTIRRYLDIAAFNGTTKPTAAARPARPAPLLSSSATSAGAPRVLHQRIAALGGRLEDVAKEPVLAIEVQPEAQRAPAQRPERALMAPVLPAGPSRPMPHQRSVSHAALSSLASAAVPERAPLPRPVRLPTASSVLLQDEAPRRFAPPARILRPLSTEERGEPQHRGPSRPAPGMAAALGHGKRLPGQAQRRVVTGPAGVESVVIHSSAVTPAPPLRISKSVRDRIKDMEREAEARGSPSPTRRSTALESANVPLPPDSPIRTAPAAADSPIRTAQAMADSPRMPDALKIADLVDVSYEASKRRPQREREEEEASSEERIDAPHEQAACEDMPVLISDEQANDVPTAVLNGHDLVEDTLPHDQPAEDAAPASEHDEDQAQNEVSLLDHVERHEETASDAADEVVAAVPEVAQSMPDDAPVQTVHSETTSLSTTSTHSPLEAAMAAPVPTSQPFTRTSSSASPIRPAASAAASAAPKPIETAMATMKPALPSRRPVAAAPRVVSRAPSGPAERKSFRPVSKSKQDSPVKTALAPKPPVPRVVSCKPPVPKLTTIAKAAPSVAPAPVIITSTASAPLPKPGTGYVSNLTKPTAATAARSTSASQPKPAPRPLHRVASSATVRAQVTLPPVKRERVQLKPPLPSFRPVPRKPAATMSAGAAAGNKLAASATSSRAPSRSGLARVKPEAIALPASPVPKAALEVPLPASPGPTAAQFADKPLKAKVRPDAIAIAPSPSPSLSGLRIVTSPTSPPDAPAGTASTTVPRSPSRPSTAAPKSPIPKSPLARHQAPPSPVAVMSAVASVRPKNSPSVSSHRSSLGSSPINVAAPRPATPFLVSLNSADLPPSPQTLSAARMSAVVMPSPKPASPSPAAGLAPSIQAAPLMPPSPSPMLPSGVTPADLISPHLSFRAPSTVPPLSDDDGSDTEDISFRAVRPVPVEVTHEATLVEQERAPPGDLIEFSAPSRKPATAPRHDVSTPAKSAEASLKAAVSPSPPGGSPGERRALTPRDANATTDESY
ncbi:hypothetical protein Q5752_001090 [Cryptotrichosporon argae]